MTNAATQATQTLTQQYYNVLCAQLNLSPNQFQLAQGNVALGTVTSTLWSAMDTVPATSVVQNWTPGNYNSFASNFGSVLSRIHASSAADFQAAMGDYYNAWRTYLAANPPSDYTKIPALFKTWSLINMDPGQAQKCYTLFNQAFIDPIGQAQEMWIAAGNAQGVMAYGTTIEMADNQVAMAPGGSAILNSSTASSDVSHTWAQGSADGLFDFFSGGASGSYDHVVTTLTDAGINMNIAFTHIATLPVSPLASGSITAGPTTYPAWYVSAALQTAYNNNNYNTWNPGSPDWNSFFGTAGTMTNATRALIVVDGISITLTSQQSISTADQEQFKAAFNASFFPFFGVSGSGGWSNSQTFNDAGQLVVTSNCATGNPQVLGVLVSSIANTLAAPAVDAARRSMRAEVPVRTAMVLGARGTAGQGGQLSTPQLVTTAWTPAALRGLRALGVNPDVEALIAGMVNTWANNAAPNWALNTSYQYVSPHPQYTATARVVARSNGNNSVNVTNFV